MNTCYNILETTKSTNKLAKRLGFAEIKLTVRKTKTMKLLLSYENLQLLQLDYKKKKKVTFTCDVDHKYTLTYH